MAECSLRVGSSRNSHVILVKKHAVRSQKSWLFLGITEIFSPESALILQQTKLIQFSLAPISNSCYQIVLKLTCRILEPFSPFAPR